MLEGTILAYKDVNLPEEEILARLQKQFGMTQDEARKVLNQYRCE